MDNYAQLLSDYQKIRAEMEKFKKDRLDLFLKSVPDSFGVKLCEFDDESIKDFSQDMLFGKQHFHRLLQVCFFPP